MNSTQTTAQKQTLATVHYDRSSKQYIVRNGHELARFPAGAENKVKAQWLAISHDNGQVYEVARQMVEAGHDEQRVIRAARLLIEGKLLEHHQDGDYSWALVQASEGNRSPITGDTLYYVTHNIIWKCDCQDWVNQRDAGNRQPRCKHCYSVMLLEKMTNQAQAETETAALRQAEEHQDRARALRQTCPTCGGSGQVIGINTWTGFIGRQRCPDCSLEMAF
jgi:hypothetical protein